MPNSMSILPHSKFLIAALSSLALIGISAATSQTHNESIEFPSIRNDSTLRIETVSSGQFKFPTSMAFLGSDDILVLEKNEGTVRRIVNGTVINEPLLDVNVATKNERGLLGIAVATNNTLDPNYEEHNKTKSAKSTFVFLYFTEVKGKDGDDVTNGTLPLGNRLYRYEMSDDKLVNPKLLLEIPAKSHESQSGAHNGGKVIIGPDNRIYLVVGDMMKSGYKTQNYNDGKAPDGSSGILRINQDGKEVEMILGNDEIGKYFAYGIRNSFGIAFDPVTGNLWDTENGPDYGDEINLVKPGFNSGWQKVQGFWAPKNETAGNVFQEVEELVYFNGKGEYSSPEFVSYTIGLTDLAFLNSDKLGKKYENDMFVGDFHNDTLYHFDLSKNRMNFSFTKPLDDKIANGYSELEQVIFAQGFGGITDVEMGPDGYLYVLATDFGGGDCIPKFPNDRCIPYSGKNMGSIFRVVPSK